MDLVKELLTGNPRAIAKAISFVEDEPSKAHELLKQIFPQTGESFIIGITGAPGTGKSTLVNHLIDVIRKGQSRVGIIAVDPSSPFSGGAILGDRIRMMRHSTDPEVYIRSMATRGYLGGLSRAAGESVVILEAAGMNYILIETVGVGQDEVDVVKLADLICVVLTPDSGDDIQAFKAGIMEIADIFALNKADSPGSDTMERQIEAMLDLSIQTEKKPVIIKTIATSGEGIPLLWEEIKKSLAEMNDQIREQTKKQFLSKMLLEIIQSRIYLKIEQHLPQDGFNQWVDRIYRREIDPYSAAEQILTKMD